MSDSGQKFIRRNRAPRVHISYDDPYDAEAKIELPFVMGVLSDLSGNNAGVEKPDIGERNFLEFDMDNFDKRMAAIEPGVTIEAGAVVGPRAEIGSGTVITAGSIIGPDVRIGRDVSIGPAAVVTHALIGNRVIVHAGVCIGQDGFGFIGSSSGPQKIVQLGRVIIQDDVEIGANTTIDRGSNRDTIIGEGTKIDNLVQVGHNVVIGRNCLIAGQVGISGSVTIGDLTVLGGKVGVRDNVSIGRGAAIAASSAVGTDVPDGARWGGTPARPIKEWLRESSMLRRLTMRRSSAVEGEETLNDDEGDATDER